MTNGPTQIWAHAEARKGSGTEFGCAMCVFTDSTDAPLTRVFFWNGSTYCSKHLKELQSNA